MFHEQADKEHAIGNRAEGGVDMEIELSTEALQIAVNQLKAGDQVKQLRFFADYVTNNFLPPEIFIQLQDVVFQMVEAIVNGTAASDEVLALLFSLIQSLADLFNDQLDYSCIVRLLVQYCEHESAFLALAEVVKGQYRAAREFLGVAGAVKEKLDEFEFLHMIYCVSYHKDLVTDLMLTFDDVVQALGKQDQCATALSTLSRFAENPIALDKILSQHEVADALLSIPKSNQRAKKAERNLVMRLTSLAPDRCLQMIAPIVQDLVTEAVNSSDIKTKRIGIAIARNLCQFAGGIELLLELGVLQFLFNIPSDSSYEMWELAFEAVCTAICNGPDIVAVSFDLPRVLESLISLLSSEHRETKLLGLTTLQTLIGAHVKANKRELNDAIAADDALMELLSDLSESGDRNVALVSSHVITILSE